MAISGFAATAASVTQLPHVHFFARERVRPLRLRLCILFVCVVFLVTVLHRSVFIFFVGSVLLLKVSGVQQVGADLSIGGAENQAAADVGDTKDCVLVDTAKVQLSGALRVDDDRDHVPKVRRENRFEQHAEVMDLVLVDGHDQYAIGTQQALG
jgi:hypothetical protein